MKLVEAKNELYVKIIIPKYESSDYYVKENFNDDNLRLI